MIRLPASPPASTRIALVVSTPCASRKTIASATSSMVPATTSWLAALTVWPDPLGPTCTMVDPSASSTGSAASKSLGLATHHDGQLALDRAGLAAADRRVQRAQAAPARLGGELHRHVRRDRAHVQVQGAGPGGGVRALLAQADRGDVRPVGQHRDDDLGLGDRVRHAARRHPAGRGQLFAGAGAAVVPAHGVPGPHQVGGHRGTHDAEADEGDLGHALLRWSFSQVSAPTAG